MYNFNKIKLIILFTYKFLCLKKSNKIKNNQLLHNLKHISFLFCFVVIAIITNKNDINHNYFYLRTY